MWTRPRWHVFVAAGMVAVGCSGSKEPTADAGASRDAGRDTGRDAAIGDAGEDGGSAADAGDPWPVEDGVRGLRFDPETPALEGGVANVDPWLARYDEEDVRQAVLTELRSVRRTARLTAVTLVMSQIAHFDWPAPAEPQLRHLVRFIEDANAEGLRVILLISHPCILPNSIVENADPPVGANQQHVGGHAAGETVNGITLYWDVPRCEDSYLEDSIAWWHAILGALEPVADGIVYVAHAGRHTVPFTVEMNNLGDNYRFLDAVLEYLSVVIPEMRTHGIPIGVSTIPSRLQAETDARYSFLDNLQRAVPLDDLDVIDITSWVDDRTDGLSIDPDAILARVGEGRAGKVHLTDFMYRETDTARDEVTERLIDVVRGRALGGYWIWQYKPGSGLEGIREAGHVSVDAAGWDASILDVLVADDRP